MDTLNGTHWKEVAEAVEAIVTSGAIILAGLWAYITFVWRREGRPRIEFEVRLENLGTLNDFYVVEAASYVRNKGLVRHKIDSLQVRVRLLMQGDKPAWTDDDLAKQTKFPCQVPRAELITKDMGWSFIEAGTSQRYSRVIHFPRNFSSVLVWAKVIPKEAWMAKAIHNILNILTETDAKAKKAREKEDWYTAQRLYHIQSGQLVRTHTASK